ncbi:MAG: hypothetical protein AAGC60_06470 [Acidobacteriota bacterium]
MTVDAQQTPSATPSDLDASHPESGHHEARRPGGLRFALVGLCLVATVAAALQIGRWHGHRSQLLQLLDDAGVAAAHPTTAERLRREHQRSEASLITSRSLVYRVLSLHAVQASDEARRRAVERLGPARELARSVLRQRPGDWQAAMLLGTSTYLEHALARDRRLITEADAWRVPLAKAVRDGRGHPEPRRLLATAYLESWGSLSVSRRQEARELLAQVFDDDLRAFEALLPAWLAVAPSFDEAQAIVPDRPAAWRSLERELASRGDWRALRIAHDGYLTALQSTLEDDLAEARERLRLGDYFRSRSMFLRVVVAAPPSMRFLPLVEEALELYPPGLHGMSRTESLRSWLDWVLELDAVGVESMAPRALGHLLDALGDLEPPDAARAAMVAGDLYQAERFERLSDSLQLAQWAPYLTVKARNLVARGKVTEAARMLDTVPTFARGELSYAVAAVEVAQASGNLAGAASARQRLEEMAARRWSPAAWRWARGRPVLELLPAESVDGLVVELPVVPVRGAVVDVRWDGASLGLVTVRRGTPLRLSLAVDASPHLLELRSVAGGEVTPGEVRLAPR